MPQPDELLCTTDSCTDGCLPPDEYTIVSGDLDYPITFPYVNQNDVVVFNKVGTLAPVLLNNLAFDSTGTYTIVNKEVVFTGPNLPAVGSQLIIARYTDICNMLVVYQPGASIRAQDLNAANTQLLNLIQENYVDVKDAIDRLNNLLTTPLYQLQADGYPQDQDASSWTNDRIPSGAAALAQLNATIDSNPIDAADYYDGKFWFQPSSTTQAIGVNVVVTPGSSSGLSPAWPGANDLNSSPNVTQTYDFDQNVSGTGSNLRISVNIQNSQVSVVSIINGGESWVLGDTAETTAIPVTNGSSNSGTITLTATVTATAPGQSQLKIRDGSDWTVVASNDPSANPFVPLQTFYVNTQGNDANSGRTPSTAFRTIKKAVYECNLFKELPETLTYVTSGANIPVYNNTGAAVGGVPPGYIRFTCTTATGLDSGDIVTIPQATWNCGSDKVYPEGGDRQYSVIINPAEPNNLYIDVGLSNTAHTYVNDTPGGSTINVRRARVGDNFQIQVAPGSYDEMLPIVIYAKNLCITGSSLRNTYVHPRIVAGTQPDGSTYTPASLGNVLDSKGNSIEIFDTETRTMFYCDNGSYINNMTVCGIKTFYTTVGGVPVRGGGGVDPDSTYGLPQVQGWVAALRPSDATLGSLVDGSVPSTYTKNMPGSFISKSPYIQNCTNFSDININNGPNFNPQFLTGEGGDSSNGPTGGGILVDGNSVSAGSPLASFVVDAFTQISLNGPGVLATNNGYAQLVSFFGTFCWYHAKSLNGGQLNLSNCTTDFGQWGLIADGRSALLKTGTTNAQIEGFVNTPPINAGSVNDVSVQVDGLESFQPQPEMIMQIGTNYYQILSVTANTAGSSTVTVSNPFPSQRSLNLGFNPGTVAAGTDVNFYWQSYISTSGHTFEYCGYGMDYDALPKFGGLPPAQQTPPIVDPEIRQIGGETGGTYNNSQFNGGRVWYSSTDQFGNFAVGDTLTIEQKSGAISIDPSAVSSNLVTDLTPNLGGDLGVNGFRIIGGNNNASPEDGDIVLAVNGTHTFIADSETALQVPAGTVAERTGTFTEAAGQIRFNTDTDKFEGYDGTDWSNLGAVDTSDIGTNPNQIPLNQMLGQMAFVDNVATLRPFQVNLAAPTAATVTQPVFNGEGVLVYNYGSNTTSSSAGLYFNYRAPDGTVVLSQLTN